MKIVLALSLIIFCEVESVTIYRFDYTYYPSIGGSIKLHLVPEKWFRASRRCSAEGSQLAWPINKALLTKMTSILQTHYISRAFVGISAIFSKGDYSSVDGVPLAKITIPWAKGEPDNANYDEDCLTINKDGFFADANCSLILPYMCFKQHDKNIKKNILCGTVDPAYVFSNTTNSCYKMHQRRQTWHNAYQICHAEGAHLLTIDSREENKVIEKILFGDDDYGLMYCRDYHNTAGESHAGYYRFWEEFGGHNVFGKLLTQFPGYSSESLFRGPNFKGYCATITRYSLHNRYLVNYIQCEKKFPFVCEKEIDSLLASGHRF